jgi:hypothetical protein
MIAAAPKTTVGPPPDFRPRPRFGALADSKKTPRRLLRRPPPARATKPTDARIAPPTRTPIKIITNSPFYHDDHSNLTIFTTRGYFLCKDGREKKIPPQGMSFCQNSIWVKNKSFRATIANKTQYHI